MTKKITLKPDHNKISEEIGNILFTCSHIARHDTNNKTLSNLSLEDREELWQKAKDQV